MTDTDRERYPVGPLPRASAPLSRPERAALIAAVAAAPGTLRSLIDNLTDAQLDTPYRAGGWTIRQLVHHLADSHINAYVRMKFAATEDAPAIKPYDEKRWAELPEARTAPPGMSLDLLDALHRRWTAFLTTLPEPVFHKPYDHPDLGLVSIDEALRMYEWHGRHHTAHVRLALARVAAANGDTPP